MATAQSIVLWTPAEATIVFGGIFVGIPAGVFGLGATIANTVHVGGWKRGSTFWQVTGFIVGGASLVGGVALLALPCTDDPPDYIPRRICTTWTPERQFGVAFLSAGVVVAGMALWSTLLPQRRLRVLPTPIQGPLGNVRYGLTLSVASF